MTTTNWRTWNTSISTDAFGSMIDAWAIKQGLIQTLETWFPTYVAEFNRQVGEHVLDVPYEYEHKPGERWNQAAPALAVSTFVMETLGAPDLHGDGRLSAVFRTTVALHLFGTADWNESEALLYAAAAMTRQMILQNRSLNGVAQSTQWRGVKYLVDTNISTPLLTALVAELEFGVMLADVGTALGGVTTPSVGAPAAQPEVLKVETDVTGLTLQGG